MSDNRGESSGLPYLHYEQVPYHRRQWFFWICWIVFAPIAILILLTGDVHYLRQGQLTNFGMANRVVAGIIAVIWAYLFVGAMLGAG